MTKPLFLLGEAWGEHEERIEEPFVGPSGVALLRMLADAKVISLSGTDQDFISDFYRRGDPKSIRSVWLRHPEVHRTNVFALRPLGNKLETLCGPRDLGIPSYGPVIPGKYIRVEYSSHLDRLAEEILALDPNLIVPLGGTALWALTGSTGITKVRGTIVVSTHCAAGYKLLPTYHPAAVLRQWELRPTTVADLQKAFYEQSTITITRPSCEVWIEPTLEDLARFPMASEILSVDIETTGSRVTCIGFAPSPNHALVVPFDDSRSTSGSYWPTPTDERLAWDFVREVLHSPTPKLFQNGLYDIAFLWRSYGIKVRNALHDTMLLSHALQPEALKGLGYLGSLYTDFGPWKTEHRNKTIGRDK